MCASYFFTSVSFQYIFPISILSLVFFFCFLFYSILLFDIIINAWYRKLTMAIYIYENTLCRTQRVKTKRALRASRDRERSAFIAHRAPADRNFKIGITAVRWSQNDGKFSPDELQSGGESMTLFSSAPNGSRMNVIWDETSFPCSFSRLLILLFPVTILLLPAAATKKKKKKKGRDESSRI